MALLRYPESSCRLSIKIRFSRATICCFDISIQVDNDEGPLPLSSEAPTRATIKRSETVVVQIQSRGVVFPSKDPILE